MFFFAVVTFVVFVSYIFREVVLWWFWNDYCGFVWWISDVFFDFFQTVDICRFG